MKKALLKIGIVAALAFSTTLFKKEPYHFLPFKKISYSIESSKKYSSYHRMLSLNHEDFKTHFIGCKSMTKSIQNFEKDFFIDAVHSHLFYVGGIDHVMPNQMNQIFESVDSNGDLHFYFQHPHGTRHFSIQEMKIGDHVAYYLQNSSYREHYPSLKDFLECTLKA
ncbi:MAG: hypothetical protein H7A41_07510 [Chlamydiales bacterium]|nr:hypothetical protein [Chlamydiales bacterium]